MYALLLQIHRGGKSGVVVGSDRKRSALSAKARAKAWEALRVAFALESSLRPQALLRPIFRSHLAGIPQVINPSSMLGGGWVPQVPPGPWEVASCHSSFRLRSPWTVSSVDEVDDAPMAPKVPSVY